MNWDTEVGIYTLSCVKQIARGSLVYSKGELSLVLCGDLGGWGEDRREIQVGAGICMHIADSLHCIFSAL